MIGTRYLIATVDDTTQSLRFVPGIAATFSDPVVILTTAVVRAIDTSANTSVGL
jgi:hypothetical protein